MAGALGKATTSTRTMWKGAISFGLVHIPVGLYSATASSGIDFDWLDRRSMEPVGYKRVNKITGEEITSLDIVKGVEYEEGRYVVLSTEEIAAAFPQVTQTIEIEAEVLDLTSLLKRSLKGKTPQKSRGGGVAASVTRLPSAPGNSGSVGREGPSKTPRSAPPAPAPTRAAKSAAKKPARRTAT